MRVVLVEQPARQPRPAAITAEPARGRKHRALPELVVGQAGADHALAAVLALDLKVLALHFVHAPVAEGHHGVAPFVAANHDSAVAVLVLVHGEAGPRHYFIAPAARDLGLWALVRQMHANVRARKGRLTKRADSGPKRAHERRAVQRRKRHNVLAPEPEGVPLARDGPLWAPQAVRRQRALRKLGAASPLAIYNFVAARVLVVALSHPHFAEVAHVIAPRMRASHANRRSGRYNFFPDPPGRDDKSPGALPFLGVNNAVVFAGRITADRLQSHCGLRAPPPPRRRRLLLLLLLALPPLISQHYRALREVLEKQMASARETAAPQTHRTRRLAKRAHKKMVGQVLGDHRMRAAFVVAVDGAMHAFLPGMHLELAKGDAEAAPVVRAVHHAQLARQLVVRQLGLYKRYATKSAFLGRLEAGFLRVKPDLLFLGKLKRLEQGQTGKIRRARVVAAFPAVFGGPGAAAETARTAQR